MLVARAKASLKSLKARPSTKFQRPARQPTRCCACQSGEPRGRGRQRRGGAPSTLGRGREELQACQSRGQERPPVSPGRPAAAQGVSQAGQDRGARVPGARVPGARVRAAIHLAPTISTSRPQQQGRQRRAERQGIEGRDDRRGGNRQGELPEKLARNAPDERAGHEDRAQNQPHGDHRPGNLAHGLERGVARQQSVLDVVLHRLDHHDRVVDHDPDRQHQAEEREVVEAEAHHVHHGERAHDGHGHGNQGNQGRAPVLQEQQHHQRNQDNGVAQRLDHFLDALPCKGRRVVTNDVGQVVGEILRQLLHFRPDGVAHFQGVGVGQLEDDQPRRPQADAAAAQVLVLGPQNHAAHVADANDAAVRRGAKDDVGELCGILEPAKRGERDLRLLPGGHRRPADLSAGRLGVLLPQRGHDVAGRETPRGELLRVDPDPHAVIALPGDEDVADPRQAEQLVADIHQRIVAQVELVVAAVGRDDVDAHEDVGHPFPRRHAGLLDHVGQHRQGQVHPVLHQHLGQVQVHPLLEGHREIVGAVVGRRRFHVQHPLHAVNLLLDGRGHGLGYHLGAGAGIGATDLHRRRSDRRILRQGQIPHSQPARQRDHNRQHGGEDRAVNEETGEHRR